MDPRLLSVVMPVHNGLPFLDASIASILKQTLSDFEFVILNDASTDGTQKILREWEKRDSRIRVIESNRNLGLSGSANLAVCTSRAPIVARMDADDVSHPRRLERQFNVMQGDTGIVAIGTLCDGIDAEDRTTRPRDRWRIIRRSNYIPFPHGSAMFRRDAFDAIGGYDEELVYGEDQNFFLRMTALGRVVTLPDVLYHFRYHTDNTTVRSSAGDGGVTHNNRNGNGFDVSSLHMLGSMRLWSGNRPGIKPQDVVRKISHLNLQSMTTLATASLGTLSPKALRFALRSVIRARDGLACLRIKDGRPYEWRLK
jgi:glycosyltransferase involved in cell wall biosynthesis